ncbi:MAG: hypothetical protein OJF48_004679 [Afipia sp.]|nr:MAG: hypothetical protein OJF48_004679 [Afipia sp.]
MLARFTTQVDSAARTASIDGNYTPKREAPASEVPRDMPAL